MLKPEDNELLTRTSPDTPMGQLFRRYWIPAIASNELELDGAPVKVKLLHEDLVAFRDSEGNVGLVDEKCPHRGTSLALGINRDCGLTCIYHGWKFDVHGRCVDLPSEPEDSGFREKIKLKSYPVKEVNGIVWTYMGPEEEMPPLPDFYFMRLPEENVLAERVWQDCNYLQAMENDVDFVHAAFLHRAFDEQAVEEGILSTDLGISPSHPLVKNPPVKQEVVTTNYGRRCIAVGEGRTADEHAYMEIHYIFPFYTYPPRFMHEDGMWHAFIPRDDYSLWSWDVQFAHNGPINREMQNARRGLTLDENRRKIYNVENGYGQDRELMWKKNFSGIRGIAIQDHSATESMGPIVDRSIEHLGTSDLPVIQMRRALLKAVKEFQQTGKVPELKNDVIRDLLSAGIYAEKGKRWEEVFPTKEEYVT